jgi:hypothetical protein
MDVLARIAGSGVAVTLLLHLFAMIGAGWPEAVLFSLPGLLLILLAVILMVWMVISAWEWSWGDFLSNITDDMPSLAKTLAAIILLYPFFLGAIGTGRGQASADALINTCPAGVITAAILPLYLLPALYFWKERPR